MLTRVVLMFRARFQEEPHLRGIVIVYDLPRRAWMFR